MKERGKERERAIERERKIQKDSSMLSIINLYIGRYKQIPPGKYTLSAKIQTQLHTLKGKHMRMLRHNEMGSFRFSCTNQSN